MRRMRGAITASDHSKTEAHVIRLLVVIFLILALALPFAGYAQDTLVDSKLLAEAKRIAQSVIIVDTHIDAPYRIKRKPIDITVRTEGGDFDYVRAREGGLNGAFMSIFTPARLEEQGGSRALADTLIDVVQGVVVGFPTKFGLATSPQEVREIAASGRVALILGMENGSPLEGDLRNLKHFEERGVRYITLAHGKDNQICDSSYDDRATWKGLSPFGRRVVSEMNRLGVIVDVSHVSDDAFYQILELTKAPVIASHSSCRRFTPGFHRNMDDDMIRALARNGGVIHINFGSTFIDDEVRRRFDAGKADAEHFARDNGFDIDHPEVRAHRRRFYEEHPVGFADVRDVADHIDHVVRLVGADHVGLGSDFDGVGDSLPTGLKDVSDYPNLIYELLKRGYTRDEVEKICSGNLFRVWKEVELVAGRTPGSN